MVLLIIDRQFLNGLRIPVCCPAVARIVQFQKAQRPDFLNRKDTSFVKMLGVRQRIVRFSVAPRILLHSARRSTDSQQEMYGRMQVADHLFELGNGLLAAIGQRKHTEDDGGLLKVEQCTRKRLRGACSERSHDLHGPGGSSLWTGKLGQRDQMGLREIDTQQTSLATHGFFLHWIKWRGTQQIHKCGDEVALLQLVMLALFGEADGQRRTHLPQKHIILAFPASVCGYEQQPQRRNRSWDEKRRKSKRSCLLAQREEKCLPTEGIHLGKSPVLPVIAHGGPE